MKEERERIRKKLKEINNYWDNYDFNLKKEEWKRNNDGSLKVPENNFTLFEKKYNKHPNEFFSDMPFEDILLCVRMIHGFDYMEDFEEAKIRKIPLDGYITSEGFSEEILMKIVQDLEELKR